MPVFTDQLNRPIEISKRPLRIISLVPSQTELLYHLGLNEQVIGITKFCVHPKEWFSTKQRIGGTKNINIQKIKELNPNLIIANKEENVQQQVEELSSIFPVWVSDVNTLADAYQMMKAIGTITGKQEEAAEVVFQVKSSLLQQALPTASTKACYLIWKEPYMTVGCDTFIHQMMLQAGFENVFENKRRYPVVTTDDIQKSGCDVILLSSEPYPFKQDHIDELKLVFPQKKILLADGELFSWYGSRLLKSACYFQKLQQQIIDTIL